MHLPASITANLALDLALSSFRPSVCECAGVGAKVVCGPASRILTGAECS